MSKKETITDIVRGAVRDLSENGFSFDRLRYWQVILSNALMNRGKAGNSEERIAKGLADLFLRKTKETILSKSHPGIDRFTVQRIAPELRGLLNERILVSADLIRLNRDRMIARTLDRFSGWASSVPTSGATYDPKDTAHIVKPLQDLPFEERRLMIDQGHKLVSNVNYVIALQSDAIAGMWRHVHQPGYDGRPEHEARDEKWYLLRDSWAVREGLVKGPYVDQQEMPAEKIFCRCWYLYSKHLSELPANMLTAKGQKWLEEKRTA